MNLDKIKNIKVRDLIELGISDPKDQQYILNFIKYKNHYKVFNDPIHGSIELHPLLVRIVDTPEFQRLRHIKQLGVACYVYPGACHTRFEHSIGVAHLAGELVKSLKTKHNDLISEEDILCVQIAGLCHDLGHGPFSHLFDDICLIKHKTKHEELSVKMFDHLVKKNNLEPLMKVYGVEAEDLTFIKEMIIPTENNKGRPEKSFLYEIVSNKTSGIDVDKFDYFARDCYHMGIEDGFDHNRYLKFARLCVAEDKKKHISIREKEVHNLYAMFHTRYLLHKRACQHKVKYGIDLMIEDVLKAAKTLTFEGSDKIKKTIDDIIEDMDMELYTKLMDCVLYIILNDPNLHKAREIIERIFSRDLYKCLGEVLVKDVKQIEEYKKELTHHLRKKNTELESEDLKVVHITFDYGMKDMDPVENMYFYTKSDPDKAIKITKDKVSQLLPVKFSETVIRVYWKRTDMIDAMNDAKEQFRQWCRKKGFPLLDD